MAIHINREFAMAIFVGNRQSCVSSLKSTNTLDMIGELFGFNGFEKLDDKNRKF